MNVLAPLLKNQRGSVTVEMAFVIIGFVLLLAIIVDFGTAMLKQSKLDRTNASVAAVFRERLTFYSPDNTQKKSQAEQITQDQTDQLGRLAIRLLHEPQLSMRVEALYFASQPTLTIDKHIAFNFGPTSCGQNLTPLAEFTHLSPYSSLNRWMPLYRVTTCMPGRASWFKKIIGHSNAGDGPRDEILASNITIPR